MLKLNKHLIDEPIDLLTGALQKLLDDARSNPEGKFSREKMQRINRLLFIFKNFLKETKEHNLPLEYEFFESASALIDQIIGLRDTPEFVKKAKVGISVSKIDLLNEFDSLVGIIYEAVYTHPIVEQVAGKNVPHIIEKLVGITDIAAAEKMVDEAWGKMDKLEKVSHEADKKLTKVVEKIQDLHEAKVTAMPDDLIEEFKKVSMEAYAIGAAATLALEESTVAKTYLEKLIAE